jgi:vitamin K-dependent gamma-carboxylase
MKNTTSRSGKERAIPAIGSRRRTPGRQPTGLLQAFWQPVDIAWLVFFRIAFGGIMLWEVLRYFAAGRIRRYYIEPTVFFSYFGFDWIKPWPGAGMYVHFIIMGVLAACVMMGLFYRVAALLFAIAFTYVFLLDQSLYLNHFYLICLISFLMVFVPAHRAGSLDARWGITSRSPVTPAWTLWLLRAQIGLVYFFGGVAKLNWDWLRGEPIRDWLAFRSSTAALGPLLAHDATVWLFAYGGLLFDLLVVPALLWRRTRMFAFVLAVLFHLTNAALFHIGLFPWLMIAATTIFFSPDWPRRWFGTRAGLAAAIAPPEARGAQIIGAALMALHLSVQVLIPLRHWLYPGNVNWTEEGHRFSWRMKLRDKAAEAQFYVTDAATGQTQLVLPQSYLKPHQFAEVVGRPDMILQFAHYLAEEARRRGGARIQVRAFVRASLNGRAPHLLIDPAANLAAVRRSLRSANWIRPLGEPLRRANTVEN